MKLYRHLGWLTTLSAALVLAAGAPAMAGALIINANTAGITAGGGLTQAQVLAAINGAVSTMTSLYSTGNVAGNVTLNVTFTDTAAAGGNLELTTQFYSVGGTSYANYAAALAADAKANPTNTNLNTAVANLGANGANQGNMVLTYAQASLLSLYGNNIQVTNPGSTVNINSNQNFAGGGYDLVGGLEHELDEVLGGGGAGSSLNNFSGSGAFGATDLYRYTCGASPTGSYTTSGTANSCFSIDGGQTDLVYFNQNSGGDYGDFAGNLTAGTGSGAGSQNECGTLSPGPITGGQYIQNAFNCTGADEAYTPSSTEYVMEQAIGWDPIPEPASMTLFGSAMVGLAAIRRRRAGRSVG